MNNFLSHFIMYDSIDNLDNLSFFLPILNLVKPIKSFSWHSHLSTFNLSPDQWRIYFIEADIEDSQIQEL